MNTERPRTDFSNTATQDSGLRAAASGSAILSRRVPSHLQPRFPATAALTRLRRWNLSSPISETEGSEQ